MRRCHRFWILFRILGIFLTLSLPALSSQASDPTALHEVPEGGQIENRKRSERIALFCVEFDSETENCRVFQFKTRKPGDLRWTDLGNSFSEERAKAESKSVAKQVVKGRWPLSETPSIDSLFVLIWTINYFSRGHTALGYAWRWGLTIAATPIALVFDGIRIGGEALLMGALGIYDKSSGAFVHLRVRRALRIARNPSKTKKTVRLPDQTYFGLRDALSKI
jgi:hypothetical protein